PGDRLPRGAARTASWWLSATGLSGAVVGTLQELVTRRGDRADASIPVAPFAGAALAAVNEFRRRRWEAAGTGTYASDATQAAAAKSLGMGLGVAIGLSLAATGERLFATGVSKVLSGILSGSERAYRPVGHVAALSVIGAGLYELIRRVVLKLEHGAARIEGAFDAPPEPSGATRAQGRL